MKFSVIIPVFNAAACLEKTLRQTLEQNHGSYEIVLVDDGSTDESSQICDRYAVEYPHKIQVIHQPNQGQLAARCQGVRAAKGEYCLFLDADDELDGDCLTEMQELLDRHGDPDLVICSFRYVNEDGSSRPAVKIGSGEKRYSDKTELYQMFFTSTLLNNVWTKLVRREVLLRCQIDVERYQTLRCSEDRLHSMEMLTQAETVVYTDREWYFYHLTEGSVTRSFTPEAIERFNDSALYEVTGEYLQKWQMNTPEWRNRMDAKWVNGMNYVFNRFYLQCRDKKSVLAYDWQRFLPDSVKEHYRYNPELGEINIEFAGWILYKKKAKLDRYIWKRETKKKLKKWLRHR